MPQFAQLMVSIKSGIFQSWKRALGGGGGSLLESDPSQPGDYEVGRLVPTPATHNSSFAQGTNHLQPLSRIFGKLSVVFVRTYRTCLKDNFLTVVTNICRLLCFLLHVEAHSTAASLAALHFLSCACNPEHSQGDAILDTHA